MSNEKLKAEILELKKQKNALILAHYYEDGEIQDLADFVGDSLFLAQKGEAATEPLILLAGVVFMGESVKILSPDKKVIVPDLNAGCSLVEQSPFSAYQKWRSQVPNGIAVTYINSSAEVKSISDVIVTSSNCEKIIAAIPKDRPILFGPDQNLGRFLMKKTGREMQLWPGSCQVHVLFSAKELDRLVCEHPDAVVIAHPECDEQVLAYAHVIGSTSKLLQEVTENPAKKFIVATETGIFHQMQKARPDATLLQAPTEDKSCHCNDCPFMKLNTLEKIKLALQNEAPQISLRSDLLEKSKLSLVRMMKLSRGESVQWPSQFEI